MAKALRNHHLLIGGLLLALAVMLYIAGLRSGAAVVIVLAFAVETLAWVTLAIDRSRGTFPPKGQ
jgi:hypothetical protein